MKPLLTILLFACLFVMFCSPPGIAAYGTPDSQAVSITPSSVSTGEAAADAAAEIDALQIEDPVILEETESEQPLLTPAELEHFDIPIVLNEAVNKYIRYFSVTNREVFGRWLTRTRKYAPVVTEILKKHGLPEDLVYLAMIESGFNMKAFSRAKACGPWQFINETGQRYGLRVNYWVDERRDLEKSTVAAALYLKALFDQFGCWQLAAAGYNAGEGRVERAIEKHDTTDFWKLRAINALPKETREYVPQIFAAAIIAKDPERFGFTDLDSPTYEPTKIKVPGGISLRGIAEACSLPLTELKSLNPEMLKGVTPPNRREYIVKLPGTADAGDVSRRLQSNLTNSRQIVGVIRHSVKKKDSLPRILKQYSVDSSDLALLNGDGEDFRVKKGQVLYIPRFASLRTKELTVTPVDDPSDQITEMPSRKGTGERRRVMWNDDDDSVTTPRHTIVLKKDGPSSPDSNRVKGRVVRQSAPGSRKTNGQAVLASRLDKGNAKARLTSLSVEKSSRPRAAVSGERRHPRAHGKAVLHKNKRV
jgi:membrane-bound lytic murein transglycosylase D